MDAPLGITFFKKVELYQVIKQLDRQYSAINRAKGETRPTWYIEKQVLKWSYLEHKNLTSPIKTTDFARGDASNKLKDFRLEEKMKDGFHLTKLLGNFVMHGFASYLPAGIEIKMPNENEIYFTREGLLVGEILNEIDNIFYKLSYEIWSKLWGHLGASILLLLLIIFLLKTFMAKGG